MLLISAFSTSSQAYLSWTGLLKVLNIFFNGDNKNVLPKLACPTIKMFLNLSLPLFSSLMATAKTIGSTLFLEGLQGHSGTSYQNILQRTLSLGLHEWFLVGVFAVFGYWWQLSPFSKLWWHLAGLLEICRG